MTNYKHIIYPAELMSPSSRTSRTLLGRWAAMPSELLTQALALFGESGERWGQGDYQVFAPSGVKYCALGAIRGVADMRRRVLPEFFLAAENGLIDDLLTGGISTLVVRDRIALWNDYGNRTFEEVREAFIKAIGASKKWEEGEDSDTGE